MLMNACCVTQARSALPLSLCNNSCSIDVYQLNDIEGGGVRHGRVGVEMRVMIHWVIENLTICPSMTPDTQELCISPDVKVRLSSSLQRRGVLAVPSYPCRFSLRSTTALHWQTV